jgi:hypothetical protein
LCSVSELLEPLPQDSNPELFFVGFTSVSSSWFQGMSAYSGENWSIPSRALSQHTYTEFQLPFQITENLSLFTAIKLPSNM